MGMDVKPQIRLGPASIMRRVPREKMNRDLERTVANSPMAFTIEEQRTPIQAPAEQPMAFTIEEQRTLMQNAGYGMSVQPLVNYKGYTMPYRPGMINADRDVEALRRMEAARQARIQRDMALDDYRSWKRLAEANYVRR